MIALLRQVADPGSGEGARWAEMRIHRIQDDMMTRARRLLEAQRRVGLSRMLRDEGRRAADAFLDEHGADLGKRSTADLDVLLEEC